MASTAAGRTGLVCAGGSTVDAETFLTQLYDQIHVGGADGNATVATFTSAPWTRRCA